MTFNCKTYVRHQPIQTATLKRWRFGDFSKTIDCHTKWWRIKVRNQAESNILIDNWIRSINMFCKMNKKEVYQKTLVPDLMILLLPFKVKDKLKTNVWSFHFLMNFYFSTWQKEFTLDFYSIWWCQFQICHDSNSLQNCILETLFIWTLKYKSFHFCFGQSFCSNSNFIYFMFCLWINKPNLKWERHESCL